MINKNDNNINPQIYAIPGVTPAYEANSADNSETHLLKQLTIVGDDHQTIKLIHHGVQYEFTMKQVTKALLYLLGETNE